MRAQQHRPKEPYERLSHASNHPKSDDHRKETTMKFKTMTTISGLVLVAGLATLSLSTGVASVSATSERNRKLRITKECPAYTGAAGSFCTITSSNVPEIKVGSRVLYDQ